MATKLASLFIEIGANGDKLTAELKRSSKNTKSWSKNVEQATRVVKKSFTVVAAGAGIAATALTALYISNARSLDSLGKTAAKLGDTTQDLKVFGLAAQLGGVGVDQANVALQRMTRRLAEAANGSGAAKGAIEELGLDAEALAAKRPSAAFEDIAAALDTVPLAADRVRLAMKFFDSEGVALVNVTRDALLTARGAVDAFGGALTSLEVGQIEAANDSITLMGLGFDLLGDRFTAKLAPAVKAVADNLFESSKQSQQLQDTMGDLLDSAIVSVGDFATATGNIFKFIDGRPEIAAGGLIGYLLGGKLGFLAVAAAASSIDTLDATWDALKAKFDQTLSDAERAEIDLRRIVSKMELLSIPGFGQVFGLGDPEGKLVKLEEQRREVVTILSDMGEFDRITETLFKNSEGAISVLGETLVTIGGDISRTVTDLDTRVLNAPRTPNIVVGDVGATGSAANDSGGKSPENQEKEFREQYFADRLNDEKMFQDTWTLFQKSGANDRLRILQKETSGSLSVLAQHSRTMFEINKAVGLANATVYIATGISRALELPFPANLAAAATVAFNGAAQIKTITSAKYGKGDVTSPQTDGSTPTPVINVGSANSGTAANDSNIINGDFGAQGGGITIMGFHTPGASEEQKDDERAQWLQRAQDNDLIVPNGQGGFNYTGTGSSSYTPLDYQRVS